MHSSIIFAGACLSYCRRKAFKLQIKVNLNRRFCAFIFKILCLFSYAIAAA